MSSPHWTFRWLAMLVLFAVCTFGFAAYASADPGGADSTAPDRQQTSSQEASDNSDIRLDQEADGEDQPDPAAGYMLTLTRSAFLGALFGTLIGGSLYVLAGERLSPWVIGYSAAGGVFLGTLVGTIELASRESRESPETRARRQLDTFDDALHEERRRRSTSGPSLPLLQIAF